PPVTKTRMKGPPRRRDERLSFDVVWIAGGRGGGPGWLCTPGLRHVCWSCCRRACSLPLIDPARQGPTMHVPHHFATPAGSRRDFLARAGCGLGTLALAGLLDRDGLLAGEQPRNNLNPLAPKKPHFEAKAKAVIWLFINGGPSHVDTWDHKPGLTKADGKELKGFDNNTGFFVNEVGPLMKSPFAWKQHGKSGTWVPEIFPNLARHVDKMAFVHSC